MSAAFSICKKAPKSTAAAFASYLLQHLLNVSLFISMFQAA